MKKYETIGGPLKSVDDIVIPEPTEKQRQLKAEYDALKGKQHRQKAEYDFLGGSVLDSFLIFGTAYLFGRLAHERKNEK